jgi:hypothetical protein
MPSVLFNATVAQAVAWILSVGIVALVAYGVQYLPWGENVKKIINAVAVAVLTAGVSALATFIPDSWMQLKLIDAAFALITLLIANWGAIKFSTGKAKQHLALKF